MAFYRFFKVKPLQDDSVMSDSQTTLKTDNIFRVACCLTIVRKNFFQLLYLQSKFLSAPCLTVANLVPLGISARWLGLTLFQYLVRFISQCQITSDNTIHPRIEGLLPPSSIESTLLRNPESKAVEFQMHDTSPQLSWSYINFPKSHSHKKWKDSVCEKWSGSSIICT